MSDNETEEINEDNEERRGMDPVTLGLICAIAVVFFLSSCDELSGFAASVM